ncbi:hypothetical protein HK097_010931 [Rhizophlyctis rosea]|uniref:DUF2423 domain-containing protein n=1 Tax=Rhizophlyctis rosea TaxID=64517 RepID=A0AAD5X276_9FUNG|nr:hypothetical protein HK097_010931 [Rhizophlyctis rosea]
MAKGLRSKTKRHFRTIRRQEVFGPVEEARLARLAQKQADAALQEPIKVHQPSSSTSSSSDHSEPTETEDRGRTPAETTSSSTAANDTAMEVDAAPMTKLEKERFMMTGNAFKRRQKARAKSLKRVTGGKVKKGGKAGKKK